MIGYRTYLIEGEAEEVMNNAILDSDMPLGTSIFFAKQGYAKILLKYVANGQMTLFIEGVPSPHKDSLGRNIPCNLQFVGNAENDGETLKRLTVRIASDFASFGKFFQSLISDRGGLHIAGNRLKQYIDESTSWNGKVSNKLEEVLKSRHKDGVVFLCPYGDKMSLNSESGRQIMEQLKLTMDDLSAAVIIPEEKLSEQFLSSFPNEVKNHMQKALEKSEDDIPGLHKDNNAQEKEDKALKENNSTDADTKLLKESLEMYKREYANLQKQSKVLLLITAVSMLINIILLIISIR